MTTEYFDALVPDYTMEIPGATDTETARRLLFMFKTAINGKACVLNNASTDPNTEIAISPEFESEFGYTFEEFAALDPSEFFTAVSLPIAMVHSSNNLAAPYIARCIKKNAAEGWYTVQGLTVKVDDINWRLLSFEKI